MSFKETQIHAGKRGNRLPSPSAPGRASSSARRHGLAREALDAAVRDRRPIALDEVMREAALQTRVDRKFLLTPEQFTALLKSLDQRFRVLEIDGLRTFRYASVYFDTPDFEQFRAHRQGRRRRYKVRTRTYVDSGLSMFEVKTKGRRGATVKHRLPQDTRAAGILTEQSRSFLEDVVSAEYGQEVPGLEPVLDSNYVRATFVDPHDGERLTCDADLTYADRRQLLHGPDLFVVETKTADGRGAAERALARMGIRPVSMSKYCIGMALLHTDLPANRWSRLLRRHFEWEPARAA
ncbi:polyphosphate polymerase domain-containing protein [Arthrobacter sp. JSM 101049]|uniref:polyphosphate polymerase domain-containing protein n=1 Tax=Arthrobacter sp. JSM 101049 TaxID=929097 RepID=UPI0035649C46